MLFTNTRRAARSQSKRCTQKIMSDQVRKYYSVNVFHRKYLTCFFHRKKFANVFGTRFLRNKKIPGKTSRHLANVNNVVIYFNYGPKDKVTNDLSKLADQYERKIYQFYQQLLGFQKRCLKYNVERRNAIITALTVKLVITLPSLQTSKVFLKGP